MCLKFVILCLSVVVIVESGPTILEDTDALKIINGYRQSKMNKPDSTTEATKDTTEKQGSEVTPKNSVMSFAEVTHDLRGVIEAIEGKYKDKANSFTGRNPISVYLVNIDSKLFAVTLHISIATANSDKLHKTIESIINTTDVNFFPGLMAGHMLTEPNITNISFVSNKKSFEVTNRENLPEPKPETGPIEFDFLLMIYPLLIDKGDTSSTPLWKLIIFICSNLLDMKDNPTAAYVIEINDDFFGSIGSTGDVKPKSFESAQTIINSTSNLLFYRRNISAIKILLSADAE